MPTPSDVVNGILDDLMHVAQGVSADSGLDILAAAFPRWKERSTHLLADHVSTREAARFGDLPSKPRYVSMDTWDEIFDAHMLLLTTLLADIERHPMEYGTDATATQAQRAYEQPRRVLELKRPDHVTVRWLVDHVSIGQWIGLGGLLLFAFALGMTVGQLPGVARIVGPVLGIQTPVSPQ